MTTQTPIGDYALLADCSSAALVSRGGSLDWLCLPRYDSPSVFGRLLDPHAGHFSVHPADDFEVRRRYLPGTLVLETTFVTATGTARLVDAMAFADGVRNHDVGLRSPHEVLRFVEGLTGRLEILVDYAPRPEYGLSRPVLIETPDGVRTYGGPAHLDLRSSMRLELDGSSTARGRLVLAAGEAATFALRWLHFEQVPVDRPQAPGFLTRIFGTADEPADSRGTASSEVAARLEDTIAAWRSWDQAHDNYDGVHRDHVRTSSRVLKGLTYRPTGAIVAAPTTSLPELVGGERNWDYRYAWIRDASLTFEALWIGTCSEEVRNFVSWMAGSAGGHARDGQALQIMYGVAGERDLAERTLPHLTGWRDSVPVRVGNGAHDQRQLDVYGEFLNVVWLYADRLGELDAVVQRFVAEVADAAAREWLDLDAGLWEARGDERHHVASKVLCWVALDRATKLASRIGAEDRAEEWAAERATIRDAVLRDGWSERRGTFVQAFDGDELDAALLLLPIVGFLPAGDPRMRATIEAVAAELTEKGLVLRYRSDDGLAGGEGTFLMCTFWLVICLARLGELERAEAYFAHAAACANDLGLLAEEADASTGELLGNFPQAFSHVGVITAAYELDEARRRASSPASEPAARPARSS